MNKGIKTFTLIIAIDRNWDIGSGSDYDCCLRVPELHSPTLKCVIGQIPSVCRYSPRRSKEKEEIYCISDSPLYAASSRGGRK